MDNPLISIVVPIYNVEKYLNRCIDSILCQTYSNIELVLVNDGSSDNSEKICLSYTDYRIKYVKKENGGLSSARNFGIKNSRGKYVCFIDSDDCINNRFVEILYRTLNQTKSKISMCYFQQFSDEIPNITYEDYTVESYESPSFYRLFSSKYYPDITIACNKMYDIDLFDSIMFPEGKLHEDEAILYKLLFESGRIGIANCNLYYYYINYYGITKSKININRLSYIDFLIERTEYLKQINDENFVSVTIIQMYFYYVEKHLESKNNFVNKKEFIKELEKKYIILKKYFTSKYSRFDIKIVSILSSRRFHFFEKIHVRLIKLLNRVKTNRKK